MWNRGIINDDLIEIAIGRNDDLSYDNLNLNPTIGPLCFPLIRLIITPKTVASVKGRCYWEWLLLDVIMSLLNMGLLLVSSCFY